MSKEPQTQAYKGVFKGLSENLSRPVGKLMPANNQQMKMQQYQIGWAPWQQTYNTMYKLEHDAKDVPQGRTDFAHKGKSQVQVGMAHYKPPMTEHFSSEAKNQFGGRQNNERTQTQKKLMTAQIILNNDPLHYKTVSQINHGDNLSLPKKPELQYKQKTKRFDIITNQDVAASRLDNACQFDYWNQNRDKRHVSANHSLLPQGRLGRVDPITNRIIIQ